MTAETERDSDLDLWFGPSRAVQSLSETPSGRWYALLECGHRVRTTYTSPFDQRERERLGYPLTLRCHVCKRIGGA